MKADVLFNNMKENKNYFAVVVDEYGGTSGVITIHDLLELLVGDMGDKEDVKVEEIVKLDDDNWKILGSASLEKVTESIGIEFDAEDCDTFGGYIFGLLGEVPDDGTGLDIITETDDLVIKTESVVDHHIEATVVTVKEKVSDDEDEDDEDEDDEDKKKKKKLKDKDEELEDSEDED